MKIRYSWKQILKRDYWDSDKQLYSSLGGMRELQHSTELHIILCRFSKHIPKHTWFMCRISFPDRLHVGFRCSSVRRLQSSPDTELIFNALHLKTTFYFIIRSEVTLKRGCCTSWINHYWSFFLKSILKLFLYK